MIKQKSARQQKRFRTDGIELKTEPATDVTDWEVCIRGSVLLLVLICLYFCSDGKRINAHKIPPLSGSPDGG